MSPADSASRAGDMPEASGDSSSGTFAENMSDSEPWYSVRCLFDHPDRTKDGEDHLYEERITLWKGVSYEDAFAKAEVEALKYAQENDCVFVCVSDAFHLFDEMPKEGTECFSTMRGSNMNAELYQMTYCCTPFDRTKDAPTFDEANKPQKRTDRWT